MEYVPYNGTSNHHNKRNDYNNHNTNETDESTLLAHIVKRLLPIKDTHNNRLHGDLNRLISSNKPSSSTMLTPKDKNSLKQNDEIDVNGIKYRHVNAVYF